MSVKFALQTLKNIETMSSTQTGRQRLLSMIRGGGNYIEELSIPESSKEPRFRVVVAGGFAIAAYTREWAESLLNDIENL